MLRKNCALVKITLFNQLYTFVCLCVCVLAKIVQSARSIGILSYISLIASTRRSEIKIYTHILKQTRGNKHNIVVEIGVRSLCCYSQWTRLFQMFTQPFSCGPYTQTCYNPSLTKFPFSSLTTDSPPGMLFKSDISSSLHLSRSLSVCLFLFRYSIFSLLLDRTCCLV